MGKASSAKKVARAARAGGKATGPRRNFGFPSAIVAIVVLGVGLVVFARADNSGGGEPSLEDHWHAAYGIYVCDRWVANLPDAPEDPLGIHTHGDGLIHIHPFLAGATGRSATLGRFFDQVGVKVSGSSITLPPGEQFGEREYKNDETKCGDEDARVVMAYWDDAANIEGEPDQVRTSDISGEHFDNDLGAFTIAFLPEGEPIPPPPSAPNIVELGAQDGAPEAPVEGQPEDTERSGNEIPGSEIPGSEIPTEIPTELPTDSTVGGDEPPTETTAPSSEDTEPAPSETTAPAG